MANQDIFQKILNDDIEGVKSFINEHPDKINEGDEYGQTPLMLSCGNGNREMTKLLLDAGCQINTKDDRNGCTALYFAVSKNRYEIVEMLLEQQGIQINEGDNWGQTPLMSSCERGNREITKLLLDAGCQINTKDNLFGFTALHFAVSWGHYDVVTLMLSQDSVQLDIENHEKMTPLLCAITEGHLGMVYNFLVKGANITVVNNEGNNCLHLALKVKKFHSEVEHLSILDECCTELKLGKEKRLSGVVIATYLAHHGANFYCKNKEGRTPLDLIDDEDLKEILKTLFPQCQEKMATVKLHPYSSEMTFKRCPMCQQCTISRSGSAVFLGIETSEQDINDESIDAVKRGYMMLYEWFSNCDPETRTRATLSAALEEAECFTAFEYLSSGAK